MYLQENIAIEEVFKQLRCTREGLSGDEGANRLEIFGPNKLEEKKVYYIFSSLITSSFFKSNSELSFKNKKIITGKQGPQVLGVHVESSIMGYGMCSHHGYCFGQWRGNLLYNFLT